ncbi:hypothetical protein BB561_005220 [Smittium simulii]|uniref:UBX domain-containing protein n=1 Tax=Smittium simulii TaxID=133385 RepID=A0A2T9YBI9_9FUNG|nr:hypothetical protein BB561_005220 [Smittium simulii]
MSAANFDESVPENSNQAPLMGQTSATLNQDISSQVYTSFNTPRFSFAPLVLWPFSLTSSLIIGLFTMLLSATGFNKKTTSGNFSQHISEQSSSAQENDPLNLRKANSAVKWLMKECGENYPPVYIGEYSEALAVARRGFKYMLVILVSEIQDDSSKLLEILKEQEFIDYINTNQIVFWLGSALEVSGMQVAETLMAGLLPLFALAVPRFDMESNNFKMSLIARLDGIPTNVELASNSSKSKPIIDWLALPISRHNSVIQSARRDQEERDRARDLRLEQDAAYHASLERDKIREQELRLQKEKLLQKQILRDERLKEKEILENQKLQWRNYIFNKYFASAEPTGSPSDRICTLSIRLENGMRVKRRFNGDDPTERVYMYIDTLSLDDADTQTTPPSSTLGDTNKSANDSSIVVPASLNNYNHIYNFSLMCSFPKLLMPASTQTIHDFLTETKNWPNVALVVELLDSDDNSEDED